MSKLLPYVAITAFAIASVLATAQAYADEGAPYAASPAAVTDETAPAVSEQPHTLSRAEVLADIQIWRESGLAELQHSDMPDVYSAEYQRASAKYQALRKSPRFAELVQSIAAKRGEVVAGTTSNAAKTVQ
jgi:hypothetical protein